MARKVAARALLVALGLVLPALRFDVVLRAFGPVIPGNYETGVWAEGHPIVGHFHIPGATAWVREPEFTTYLRFNQDGLRGPELAPQTSATGTRRVLLLGDSFLEAKQVPESAAV